MSFTSHYLTFSISQFHFGISATSVLEINRNLEYTIVPKSEKMIRGILNLRGQLVPAIDVRNYLEVDQGNVGIETVSVILKSGNHLAALLVDSVGDILALSDDALQKPPANFSQSEFPAITGAFQLPKDLLLILDTDVIFETKIAKVKTKARVF
jgi:purine-binding chemotaxis protein CheW